MIINSWKAIGEMECSIMYCFATMLIDIFGTRRISFISDGQSYSTEQSPSFCSSSAVEICRICSWSVFFQPNSTFCVPINPYILPAVFLLQYYQYCIENMPWTDAWRIANIQENLLCKSPEFICDGCILSSDVVKAKISRPRPRPHPSRPRPGPSRPRPRS